MCKVILIDKETGEILINKQFTDEGKANDLKQRLDKYIDPNKAELKVEHKVERKRICLKKETTE